MIWTCLELAVEESIQSHELHNVRTEASDCALFHGDEHLVVLRKPPNEVTVQGLAESSIGDSCRDSQIGEESVSSQAVLNHGTVTQKCHFRPFQQDSSLSDLNSQQFFQYHKSFLHDDSMMSVFETYLDWDALVVRREFDADSVASWVPETTGSVVNSSCSCYNVEKLGFVSRCHDNHVRQAGHVGHVECTAVCWSIGSDETSTVHCEANRQFLQIHIVDNLRMHHHER